jgi:hypothetical protein
VFRRAGRPKISANADERGTRAPSIPPVRYSLNTMINTLVAKASIMALINIDTRIREFVRRRFNSIPLAWAYRRVISPVNFIPGIEAEIAIEMGIAALCWNVITPVPECQKNWVLPQALQE